ncbi:MAG TPA: EamA family transporter [Thermoanaerobaculia bacterium]|nr:EamA family transporter [Thermoanaerobaculia bacterium]
MPDTAPKWKIAFAMGLVYLIWGSTYLAIRFAVQTLPPLTMSGFRFLIAGGVLLAWSALRGGERVRALHWRSAAISGLMLLLVGNGLVVIAEKRVESGLAALLVSTTPLFLVILAWLFQGDRRPSLPVSVGIVLGLAGVALLVRPGTGTGGVDLWGTTLLTLASIGWAAGSLYSRRAALPASPLLATGIQMLAGGAMMLVSGALLGELSELHLAQASTRSVLAFAYLVVAAVVAFTAYLWLLRNASPALVSTYSYINPLVAVVLGWALAGEPLTARTAVAALVIVSGVALITITRTQKPLTPRLTTPPDHRERGRAAPVCSSPTAG